MAYSTPYTFSALEILTAAKMNAIQTNITALWPYSATGQMPVSSSGSALTTLAASAGVGKIITSTGTTFALVDNDKVMNILLNKSSALVTGDDAYRFRIPALLNGWRIYSVAATRKSGTGTLTIQIRNVTDAVDVLSTKLTVDTGETDSSTAATPAVINTSNDDVATGDQFAIDVDDAGTSTLYATVEIVYRKQ